MKINKIKKKIRQNNFDVLALIIFSFIINSNSFKILIDNTSSLVNTVLFLLFFIIVTPCFLKKKIKLNNWTLFYYILILYLFIVSFLEGILYGNFKAMIFYCMIFTTCLFSQKIVVEKIRLVINTSVFLNVISFIRLLFSGKMGESIGEFNYLNMTLSLGFVLSIVMSEILEDNSSFKKNILVFLFLIFCQFSYPARGVVIYLLLVFLFYLIKVLINLKLKNILMLISILLGSYFIILKMNFSSSYNILSRFRNMNTVSQFGDSRRQILEAYKENINFKTMMFGNGANKSYEILGMGNISGAYPHNIFLEILADFGVIPLIFFIIIVVKILYDYKKYDLNKKILMMGFFYYIFQFSKSFSLYSSYMIWILIPIFFYENKKINNNSFL